MSLIPNWLPPSRENWELVTWAWQFFPVVTVVQWLTDFYPQGKTSIESRFNIPGKIGWASMEAPGFITLLYIMYSLPRQIRLSHALPTTNWLLAGLFTAHYLNRALLSPLLLNPSMSPIHPLVWLSAFAFQIVNAISIGGWLGGYGPTTEQSWAGRSSWVTLGAAIWAAGLLGNAYHDDKLREIRRAAMREQRQREQEQEEQQPQKGKKGVDKVYKMPQGGLFRVILFPHYVCEWIEWAGFWMIGGSSFVPARSFLLNEITTMTPRALSGKRWYLKRFGPNEVGQRTALVPGVV